jgi:maltoporin
MVKFGSAVLAVLAATAAQAADIQFHGYIRAGVGLNAKGGGQVCFQLAGADTKWRLGNECDYVVEPTFSYDIVQLDDKSTWGVVVMPSIYKAYDNQSTNVRAGEDGIPDVPEDKSIGNAQWFDDLPVRFGQVYFYGRNVPVLGNGTIWIGRRFYDRLQLGINDQFIENEDGDGAGIEDIDLGFAKWSLAFLMNPNDAPRSDTNLDPSGDVNNKNYRITTRLTNIKTVKDGALQIWLGARNLQSKSTKPGGTAPAKTDATYRAGVYHSLNLGALGSNLLGFKYETLGEDSNQWRAFVQHGVNLFSARTALDFIAEYRQTTPATGDDTTWLGVGARTDTQISGPFRFLLEAGYDRVDDGTDVENLTKVTAAFAMSSGKDAGARPTFRLFYTHAIWSDEGVLASGRTNDVYGEEKSGGSFGLQAEGWW